MISNVRSAPGWITPDMVRRVLALADSKRGSAPPIEPSVAPKRQPKVQRTAAISFDTPREELPIELAQPASNDPAPDEKGDHTPSSAPKPRTWHPLPAASTLAVYGAASAKPKEPLRSWVDEYRALAPPLAGSALSPEERRAFGFRKAERTRAATILLTKGDRDPNTLNANDKLTLAEKRRQDADATRAGNPVEQAKLFLQRRGDVVFAASVVTPRAKGWKVSGLRELLDDAALIERARAKGFAG